MELKAKTVEESRTLQHYILLPKHLNDSGSLYGGQLLSWIDMLAGVVALRHADTPVVTASIDHLDFKTGACKGDVLIMDGRVTWVGHSSMEVRIDTYRKAHNEDKQLINTAFLVMVALDENRHPKQIAGLELMTDEERQEWEDGKKRAALRKHRRMENF